MKKIMSIILTIVLVFSIFTFVPMTSFAETSGDYTYTVLNDGTAKITGYTGAGGSIEIPSQVDGYPVTCIGDGAFFLNITITDVTIPDTVTDIGTAFSTCVNLKTVNIPHSVRSIATFAFFDCDKLTDIVIPAGVVSIGAAAFNHTGGSLSVDPQNPVYDSRDHCDAIIETATDTLISGQNDTVIPDTVRRIGDYALYCSNPRKTNFKGSIPDSVTQIGDYAFYNCNLMELVIPDSVTTIGEYAFYHQNTPSRKAYIPASVTQIGAKAFIGKEGKNVDVYGYAASEAERMAEGYLNFWADPIYLSYRYYYSFYQLTDVMDESTGITAGVIELRRYTGLEDSHRAAVTVNFDATMKIEALDPTDYAASVSDPVIAAYHISYQGDDSHADEIAFVKIPCQTPDAKMYYQKSSDGEGRYIQTRYKDGYLTGYFVPTGLILLTSEAAAEPFSLGDADGDGTVTVFDATAIQRELVGLHSEQYAESAADADGDGTITVFDATEIQRFLVGLSSNAAIGKAIGS